MKKFSTSLLFAIISVFIFHILAVFNLSLIHVQLKLKFLIIPTLIGGLIGYIIGYLFNRYKEEQQQKIKQLEELNNNLELSVSEKTKSLSEQNINLENTIKALKTQEIELKKYHELIIQSSASIVITDTNGNIEYVNPAFERITGYSLEEAIGKNPRILKSGYQDELVYRNLWDTITNGKTWRGEFLNKKKNGELYWEMAIISPIKVNGNITNYFAIKDDITLLKESQTKYKEIIDNAKDGIIMLNDNAEVILWNKSAEEIFGYSQDEILGKNLHKFITKPDDYEKFKNGFENFKTTGKDNVVNNTVEVEGLTKNGKVISVEISITAFQLKGSWHTLCLVRDITLRKKLEEQIKAERDKAQLFLEIAGALIVQLDSNGNVVLINKTGCEILGYSKDEIIGKNWFDNFLPENIRNDIKIMFNEYINQKIQLPEFYENPVLNKNAEERMILWHNQYLYDNYGKVIGSLSAGMDITENKKIEEELSKKIEDLYYVNKLIEEKGYELNQAYTKLIESEEKLKEANATKDKFFSIIAHDLRGPLGASKQLIDLILSDFESISEDEKLELFNEISKSMAVTYELLEQLLSWSRCQRGVIQFEPQNIDANFFVNNVIDLLKANAKNKEINLKNEVKENIIIYSDPNMFTTIIRNLISNAIKFTPKNGEILIDWEIYKQNPNFITFMVKDTGIGISKENISKLFRIDSTFTTLGTNQEKGTGLGLILVKEFVEKHGGRIWVESELDKGTTFLFTMPKAKEN